mgnify:CR=1 FL=1
MPRPGSSALLRASGLRAAALCAVVWVAAFLSPDSALAQMPRGGPVGATPFTVGIRGGWEFTNSNWLLGAHARIGLPGVSFLDVQAVGDLTFATPPAFVGGDSFQERTIKADLLYRTGTLGFGAGAVFRNTFWEDFESPREWRTGWSGVVVLGGVANPRSAVTFQLEYRYVRIDDFGLQEFTAGVGVVPTRIF